ncbi:MULTISPECIES: histidinol dehydrogenase [Hyphobacterium]|uniref:Histidinol dehydrogenase n=1 Tax=Hyphobacterium vulgare TaxID=1736751 RepID=A0ABV6ZTK3_9PROT
MLDPIKWSRLGSAQAEALFAPARSLVDADAAAIEIVEGVRRGGEAALKSYARQFDGYTHDRFRVPGEVIRTAAAALDRADADALQSAIGAVQQFHQAQGFPEIRVETWPGLVARRKTVPIGTVGLYVPAGSAPLVSTLIMLAVPAQIAGVGRIAVVVPPTPDGSVNASVLAAAGLLGLDEIYAVGGAQAVAGLAFGIGELPRADKIFGPGNAWVAAAKAYVSRLPGGPAIDLPAGPSEVMVVADESADADFVAADLLAQAEHDPMARVVLVSRDADLAAIRNAVATQLAGLPRRAIAAQAMANAICVQTDSDDEVLAVIDTAAPEHLIFLTATAKGLAERVRNAGSIFVGPWTPESAGDYAAGPNHTLPTGRAARACGGVTVEAFQKTITLMEATAEGARNIAPTVERLAALEGLEGHAAAMRLRRERAGS